MGVWADPLSGTIIDSRIWDPSSVDPVEPLNGTTAAALSSAVGVGKVRESTPRRTSLVVTGSFVGSVDRMVPVALGSDVVIYDSTPRPTSFAVSGAVVSRADPLGGTGSAMSVGSDLAGGDVLDSAPCLTSLAALASVSGDGEGRPLKLIFFPVLLMRLKNFLRNERFGCCGLDIGYSLKDEGFR